MRKSFEQELQENLEGELYFDQLSRVIYSVDASIYQVYPRAIFCPKTSIEIGKALKISFKHRIPSTARGAATGITGGCLGSGLIIDTSCHLKEIIEINIKEKFAICQPGVIQDDLNRALAPFGMRLGADTSTGNRATLAGMVGNNAAGARSLRYGCMADHLLEVSLYLSDGNLATFGKITKEEFEKKCLLNTIEGDIYKTIKNIITTQSQEINKRFPPIPRRVSGYNLDRLLKNESINLCEIIAGSEGTLGIISSLKVAIVAKPKYSELIVLHFENMVEGLKNIEHILSFSPLSFEMIDRKILQAARSSPAVQNSLEWLKGDPEAIFTIEFEAETLDAVKKQIENFIHFISEEKIGYAYTNLCDQADIEQIWRVRKAGLGLLLSKRSYSRAIAFLEDISVSPKNVAAFMEHFLTYLKQKDKSAGIYGHIGAGCLHIRPYIDLRSAEELQLVKQMMLDISDLLLQYQGALSGEHGDGLIRSWLNEKMFGKQIYQAFIQLKHSFDPYNLMNPGKITDGPALEENLRLDPQTHINEPKTFQDFSKEGGFPLAVEMCNGNGECRKKEGIMCPSFQVTNNEYDTTRARAEALRQAMHGKLDLNANDQEIHAILDLCIECKGCKSECPSQVDMAKIKAEFLYHYQKKHGITLRSRIFGHIDKVNTWLFPLRFLFNRSKQSFFARKIASWLGIAPQRSLPAFASQRFSFFIKNKSQKNNDKKPSVVLMTDTFTEFNHPEIGLATLNIFEAMGYHVITPSWSCCGRPLISKGMLTQARRYAEKNLEILLPFAEKGLPIIGIEPSCILSVKDDFFPLVEGCWQQKAQIVAKQCYTVAAFLSMEKEKTAQFFNSTSSRNYEVFLHGHCHQKSLEGMKNVLQLLQMLKGVHINLIDSGCCGMAGSFGYEKEHYAFSMQIAELKLLPTIRKAPSEAFILADGFSCRSQISHGADIKALHLAEFLWHYHKNSSLTHALKD